MEILRTPDDRFEGLPGFAFEPHYVEVPTGDGDGVLRVHHLDEGPRRGPVVLLLHGEPSWSFLYRTMVPPLVAAGLRCVAPDLVGFGRSDKPGSTGDYSYGRHVAWMHHALFGALDLREVTLVCQDWGGLIGLRLVAEHPDRFARVVAANTGLPTGRQRMTDAFLAWQRYAQEATDLPVGRIVAGGCRTPLAAEVVAAYDAPFPDAEYVAGPRAMPGLVPNRPDDPASDANRAAWQRLTSWEKPFLVAFSDSDPITGAMAPILKRAIPGAAGLDHPVLTGAGHFLQEDAGDRLAAEIVAFIAAHPAS